MSSIKNLIATVLLSGVAAVSFAQAPAAVKEAAPATPAAAVKAPEMMTKHVTKKVEAPAAKDAAAAAAASKPVAEEKKVHKVMPAKKADTTTPAAPAASAAK